MTGSLLSCGAHSGKHSRRQNCSWTDCCAPTISMNGQEWRQLYTYGTSGAMCMLTVGNHIQFLKLVKSVHLHAVYIFLWLLNCGKITGQTFAPTICTYVWSIRCNVHAQLLMSVQLHAVNIFILMPYTSLFLGTLGATMFHKLFQKLTTTLSLKVPLKLSLKFFLKLTTKLSLKLAAMLGQLYYPNQFFSINIRSSRLETTDNTRQQQNYWIMRLCSLKTANIGE